MVLIKKNFVLITKQNYVTKTKLKKHDDNNGLHLHKSFDTENKFLNPNWMLGQKTTRH